MHSPENYVQAPTQTFEYEPASIFDQTEIKQEEFHLDATYGTPQDNIELGVAPTAIHQKIGEKNEALSSFADRASRKIIAGVAAASVAIGGAGLVSVNVAQGATAHKAAKNQYYSPNSPTLQRKIEKLQKECPGEGLLVSDKGRKDKNRYGKLAMSWTRVEGTQHSRFALTTKRKVCGAVGTTGDGYYLFPKFSWDKKARNYKYIDKNGNGSRSLQVLSVGLR